MSPELKESRSAPCLGLEIKCCTNATQDSEIFVESETVPLETVLLTEELMQTEVLKRCQRFQNQRFSCSKRQRFSCRYIRCI